MNHHFQKLIVTSITVEPGLLKKIWINQGSIVLKALFGLAEQFTKFSAGYFSLIQFGQTKNFGPVSFSLE